MAVGKQESKEFVVKANYALIRWRVEEIEWQVKVCLSFNTSYYCRKAAKVFCCWLLLHNMFVFCLTLHFFLNWYLFNTFVHCSTFIWNCIKMTPWRNGSASDSRSEGCVFESRRGQNSFAFFGLQTWIGFWKILPVVGSFAIISFLNCYSCNTLLCYVVL